MNTILMLGITEWEALEQARRAKGGQAAKDAWARWTAAWQVWRDALELVPVLGMNEAWMHPAGDGYTAVVKGKKT